MRCAAKLLLVCAPATLWVLGCGPAAAQVSDRSLAVEAPIAAAVEVEIPAAPPLDPRTEDIQVDVDDPAGDAMTPFLKALHNAEAGTGQARIAWWGASHTAADLWSGHVRRALQKRFGDAGHGYLLPFRWHGGYRHQDVNLKYSRGWRTHRHKLLNPVPVGDYGYGGVAVSSDDPKQWFEVATTVENEHGRRASYFEVWLRPARHGGTLVVTVDGRTYELSSRPSASAKSLRVRRKRRSRGKRPASSAGKLSRELSAGVVFYRFALADGAHTVRARPKGDGPVHVYGVVMQRDRSGVVVDQMGIPGARGKIQLHWQESTWRAQLRRRDPHLVILAYGTNAVGDKGAPISRFVDKWRRVLERVRAAVPRSACLLVGTTDRPTRPDEFGQRTHRPRIDLIVAAQKRVAAEYGCGFWDAFAAMGGRGSMLRWVQAGLARGDHVHLSREGYELKSERFVRALLTGYK
jgi:lysophospholipase L1-like esterase